MLTHDWFNTNLPSTINSDKDVEKLVCFLRNWNEKAKDPEEVYLFVKNLDITLKEQMIKKLTETASSYTDWLLEKQNKFSKYIEENEDKLSKSTLKELYSFLIEDADRNKYILNALICVSNIIKA